MTTVAGPGFTVADLRSAAGRRSFERGLDYTDAVTDLKTVGDRWVATVRGSEDYLVVLTVAGDQPDGSGLRAECDCPHGQEGFFCKHCVAVGLAITTGAVSVSPPRQDQDPARAGLEAWLTAQGKDELLAVVFDHLLEDDDWRHTLELRAATAALDLTAISALAGSLLDAGTAGGQYGYLEGQDCWRYARRIREITEVVTTLVRSGHGREAVAIAEVALRAVSVSSQDASDRAGVISAAAEDLAASHLTACRASRPNPRDLAGFLASLLVAGDEHPLVGLEGYRDLLGRDGFDELHHIVTAEWAARPFGQSGRRALEEVLGAAGDVDALVALICAEPDQFGIAHLHAAQLLDNAGRRDEAIALAERGLRAVPRPDDGLAEFVVQRYRAAGRLADVVTVRHEQFAAARTLTAYLRLREAAEQAGTWAQQRQWALDLLRADAEAGRAAWPGPGPALVDVLIAEGDAVAAWEAAVSIASDEQWLKLADLIAEVRPADALAVYRRLIEPLRRQTGVGVYQRLARLLTSARQCHARLGTEAAFDGFLHGLRAEQKRKTRLMRILDAHRL